MATLIRIHKNGGPEVLQYDEVPDRPLQPGEIRLKVEAIGLNRAEIMYREGQYQGGPGAGGGNQGKSAGPKEGEVVDAEFEDLGEKIADLRPFDPHEFVEALFEPVPGAVATSTPAAGAHASAP